MKKYLLVSFMTAVMLGGCSTKSADSDTSMEPPVDMNDSGETTEKFEINYSLMYDQKTQDKIMSLLKENKVPQQNMEAFFDYVNDFNTVVGPMKGSEAGFHTGNILGRLFDYGRIYDAWMEKRSYSDVNCRLTAFTLMKDFIKTNTETIEVPEENPIDFDMEVVKDIPLIKFSDDELKKYYHFYSAIPTVESTNKAILLESIHQEWENRGIEFEMNDGISLVSIFLHYPDSKTLYIGHTGVLIKTDKGYLFLEKVAPLDVFMATQYHSLEDFEDYLEVLYGNMTIPGGSSPLFLLNDQLLNQ